MKNILILAVFLTVAACNPCRWVTRCPSQVITDTVTETYIQTWRDTVVYIEENESTLEAWFYCDSMNQVILRQLDVEKTKGVKTESEFKAGVFRFRVMADSVKILNKIITEIKGRETIIMNPVNLEIEEKLKKSEKSLHIYKGIGIFGLVLAVLLILAMVVRLRF